MITLTVVATAILASCMAAAGLIASTQNSEDATRSLRGLDVERDLS
jgi:hypothetical protein